MLNNKNGEAVKPNKGIRNNRCKIINISLKNPEEKNFHLIIKFKTSEGTTHIHPEDRFHLQNLQQNLRFYRNPNTLFYFLCYNKKLPLLAPCFLVFSAGVHR